MRRHGSPRVSFNDENVKSCLCLNCPVQAGSECVLGKMHDLGPNIRLASLESESIDDIPKEYCGKGQASCTDIDFNNRCLCPSCPVYHANELSKGVPVLYFCRDGSSQ